MTPTPLIRSAQYFIFSRSNGEFLHTINQHNQQRNLIGYESSSPASPNFGLVDICRLNILRAAANSYYLLFRSLFGSFASLPSTAFILLGCSFCNFESLRTDLSRLSDLCLSHCKRCSCTRSRQIGTRL